MPEHKHLPWFEHHHSLLRLVCHYVVDVDGPEMHNRNAMPWSRLFLIGSHSARAGSSVTDIAARGKQRVFPLTPGAVLFMPPGRLLGFDFSADMRMLAFHLRLEVIPGHDIFSGRSGCAIRHDRAALVDEAYAVVRGSHHIGTVTRLRGLLLALTSDFLDGDLAELQRHQASRHRFAEVLQYIEANCRADLRVADFAALMGMSREHFAREFRHHLGISPKDFLSERIVERACARLLAGEGVGETAQALGFASPFYFSRFFKSRTGSSPSAFGLQHLGR
jgi:AraC-like DNA-binding protein